MSRHLIIGTNATVAYTAGVLAEGAVDIQKQDSDGPTSLGAGEVLADADQIRVVQGGPDGNIVSPWIYGRDMVAAGSAEFAAQTPQLTRVTLSALTPEAGRFYFKVINKSNGLEPFEFKNYDIAVGAADAVADIATAIFTAVAADLPSWLSGVANPSAGVIDLTGNVKDATSEYGAIFEVASDTESTANGGAMVLTVAVDNTTSYSPGIGDGNFIAKMEEEQMGVGYGYYNRIGQPITPTATAVKGTSYDLYHIVVTKDGSSHSQIHGVDNLIEIYVALPDSAGDSAAFEGQLVPYAADAGFTVVPISAA